MIRNLAVLLILLFYGCTSTPQPSDITGKIDESIKEVQQTIKSKVGSIKLLFKDNIDKLKNHIIERPPVDIEDTQYLTLLFESNKFELTQDNKDKIDLFLLSLLNYRNVTIRVKGFTDTKGSNTANISLSIKRAAATSSYLTTKCACTLENAGYGMSENERKVEIMAKGYKTKKE